MSRIVRQHDRKLRCAKSRRSRAGEGCLFSGQKTGDAQPGHNEVAVELSRDVAASCGMAGIRMKAAEAVRSLLSSLFWLCAQNRLSRPGIDSPPITPRSRHSASRLSAYIYKPKKLAAFAIE